MGRTLTIEQSIDVVKKLKRNSRKIVLVGGIFDLIHRGHIEFLEKAKKQGDILIALLESDEKTREVKGKKRPINNQADRAFVLSRLSIVDFVVLLPHFKSNQDYQKLVIMIRPDIIAITKNDPLTDLKKKYAHMTGGKLIEVLSRVKDYSTSKLEENL